MTEAVVARFFVDRPVRPGMVRAILDTLTAQGGWYEPHLIRRAAEDGARRISWGRPAGLLDDVARGPAATFLRVAEGTAEPVLAFQVSPSPRRRPSVVTLRLPAAALASTRDVEQLLGVGKGLYLFLESPWGVITARPAREGAAPLPALVHWGNYFGPETVSRVGPARLLTSLAFIVEILPDGGMMLVTHPTPFLAESEEGQALRRDIEASTGVAEALRTLADRVPSDEMVRGTSGGRGRGRGADTIP